MRISAVVCTYNREKIIKFCLESLTTQNFNKDEYEILIIDNNSTDNTKYIIEEFIKKHLYLNIRYIFEPQQGLSFARNKGLKEAKGKIILYIDDDAIADNNLLSEHYKTYFIDEKIACVGGKINLIFQSQRPKWLIGDFLGFYGYYNPYNIISEVKEVFGGNFSIKKQTVKLLNIYFDKNLGRNSTTLGVGEESLFCKEISKRGYKIFYNPNAIIYHIIDKDRINKQYFKNLAKSVSVNYIYIQNKLYNNKVLFFYLLEKVIHIIFYIIIYFRDLLTFKLNRLFYDEFCIRKSFFTITYGLKKYLRKL